jgi:hypothetical protein
MPSVAENQIEVLQIRPLLARLGPPSMSAFPPLVGAEHQTANPSGRDL